MKKSNLFILLAVGALGVVAFSSKLTASNDAMPSCCGDAVATTAVADAQVKPDLMTTCPVSGDKLGAMAAPYVFTNGNQEVKLCCKMCKPDFDKDPAKYLQKIEAAAKPVKN
jgi:YHS domain-containing protein